LAFGDGQTSIVFAVAVFAFVAYLAIARPDIQSAEETAPYDMDARRPMPDGAPVLTAQEYEEAGR
jgi:hypothetical protein